MKTYKYLKIIIAITVLLIIGFVSLKANAQFKDESSINSGIDLNISINSNTTQTELDEIQSMLSEHGIDSEFSEVKFSDTGELVAIRVRLSDNATQTVTTSVSSNSGINKISFGRKNGKLYVSQGDSQDGPITLFNMPGIQAFGFENDSLVNRYFNNFEQLNFDDFFMEDHPLFLRDMDSIGMGEFFENFRNKIISSRYQNSYRFYDDPDTNKLIIIDGKESNFEELEKLAKQDNIKIVDHLKPETAQSIYGPKAIDGAIIVITKD